MSCTTASAEMSESPSSMRTQETSPVPRDSRRRSKESVAMTSPKPSASAMAAIT